MNVIVANKYSELINNTNIQIMKVMSGVFKVSEIVNSFNGMYYQKIIVDATALEGFPKQEILKELASRFDTQKLILFLPPDNSPPEKFLSFLVSINIYNFTDNIKGVIQLINRSNTYDDVKKFSNLNKPIVPVTKDFEDFNDMNYTSDNQKIILGLKNVTNGIESTKLTYIIKKTLENIYKKSVVALEIDKKDFLFYGDKNMYSIDASKLGQAINDSGIFDVVLIDLGKNNQDDICTDIIYLIDPSMYCINQLMFTNRRVFDNLKGKKIVLCNSLLSEKDINIFAKEAGISIYFNLPPLNDRGVNNIINDLLFKLGIVDNNNNHNDNNSKKGLFDFFKWLLFYYKYIIIMQ